MSSGKDQLMLNKNIDSKQCDLNDAPSCSNEKIENLNAQKRAKSVCKVRFTRYKNQLFGLLDEENVPFRAAVKAVRCKLGGTGCPKHMKLTENLPNVTTFVKWWIS